MRILALNAGSNTLRYKLVETPGPGEPAGSDRVVKEAMIDRVKGGATAEAAARAVGDCLPMGIDAIGFRVVHGGDRYVEPARIAPDLLEGLRDLVPLAPLHQLTDLAVIEAALRRAPDTPGFAVFDTAFHRTMPDVARRYALPDDVCLLAFRYGFHGIAHQFVAREIVGLMGRDADGTRIISLHLGGGASACAIRDGKSVDTTMGHTPLEGLVMSTRCGDLDPGIVLALFRRGMAADEVEDLLYRKSGLLGLSGTSGDIRDLEPALAGGDARAELALEVLAYRVRKVVGAYAAALGGLDAVALSGALAENSATFRARVLRGLESLRVEVDGVPQSGGRSRRSCPHQPGWNRSPGLARARRRGTADRA